LCFWRSNRACMSWLTAHRRMCHAYIWIKNAQNSGQHQWFTIPVQCIPAGKIPVRVPSENILLTLYSSFCCRNCQICKCLQICRSFNSHNSKWTASEQFFLTWAFVNAARHWARRSLHPSKSLKPYCTCYH
jgi:hypothetical protein